MYKGDSFSIEFTAKKYEWKPETVDIHLEGLSSVNDLGKMPPHKQSTFAEALTFFGFMVFVVFGIVGYLLLYYRTNQIVKHREEITARAIIESIRTLKKAQLNENPLKTMRQEKQLD